MNQEISKYQFVKRDVVADVLGEEAAVDPIEVLIRPQGPFKLTSSQSDHLLGMYLGKGLPNEGDYFVRLGNNSGNEANGVFRVDPHHRWLLFSPEEPFEVRDSYRAIGTDYTYSGTLISLIELLLPTGFTIQQATLIRNIPNSQLGPMAFALRQEQAITLFKQQTGMSAFEAYQLEGEITLEQIISHQLLPKTPMETDFEMFISRLQSGWI